MYHQPPGCLAIDPAIDQRLGHHGQRYLNSLEIREQVRHLAFGLALAAHLRHRFGQDRPAFSLAAHRSRQLAGMGIANV